MTAANDELLKEFRTWLEKHEKLAKTTARKLSSDVATMTAHGPTPPSSQLLRARLKDYRYAWALWADFCEATERTNKLPEPPEPPAPAHTHRRGGRRAKAEPKRLRDAMSIEEGAWRRLLQATEVDDSPPARVIDVLCGTALRVADVLRTPHSALAAAFSRDDGLTVITVKRGKEAFFSVRGAEREWQRLFSKLKPGQIVAEAVSAGSSWDGNSAAYQRCRRKLIELGEQAGIDDRLHLHRLRRTVAMQVANATGNTFLVQKMLVHDDEETTRTYLDENNAIAVAAQLREYNRKMRGRT